MSRGVVQKKNQQWWHWSNKQRGNDGIDDKEAGQINVYLNDEFEWRRGGGADKVITEGGIANANRESLLKLHPEFST